MRRRLTGDRRCRARGDGCAENAAPAPRDTTNVGRYGSARTRIIEEVFGPLGVTNIRTFVDPENPTQVAVLMDVADLDALMAAMQSDEAADAMAHDGVVAESLALLIEE